MTTTRFTIKIKYMCMHDPAMTMQDFEHIEDFEHI